MSSGLGVGEAGRRTAARRPSPGGNSGGGGGGCGSCRNPPTCGSPTPAPTAAPPRAPPRVSSTAPGAVLVGPSSSQRSTQPVGSGAAGAWEPGKFGRPLAVLRSEARSSPEDRGRADSLPDDRGPAAAVSRPPSGKVLKLLKCHLSST